MARIRYSHNSFSVGIISKKIQGNTDFEGYNNALDECTNFLIMPTGGLLKRPGTVYVADLKGNDHPEHPGNARLVLFAYSAEDQYVCEFGTNYIRFFTKYGQLMKDDAPYEVATTLDYYDDIVGMNPIQEGNILYLFTPRGIFSLTRLSDTDFKFEEIRDYSYEPLTFQNVAPIGLIPSAKSGQITITVRNPDNPGQQPDAKFAPVFVRDDTGHYVVLNYNTWDEDIQLYNSMTFYLKIDRVEADGAFNKLITTIDAQRSYRNKSELPNTEMVTEWQVSAFNNARGMPKNAAMFEGRLFFANNRSFPTGIWGSGKFNNDWLDFSLGPDAADGLLFPIKGEYASEILWLVAQSKLFVGTARGIYLVGPINFTNDALTPDNCQARLFERIGVSNLHPLCALDAVFFVDASGKNVHEIVLSAETGTYQANDLSLLADDLTRSGIIAHSWQQTPIKTYWCATGAGHLCALTYLKNNEILAWSKHVLAGYNVSVSSMCTMPGDNYDRLYMIVQRDVNGKFQKYVEYLHQPHDPLTQEQFKQFYVDSGVSKFIQYKIQNIIKGRNAYLQLDETDTKESQNPKNHKSVINTIFDDKQEALVVFRWNKPNVQAPKLPFSRLDSFFLGNKKLVEGGLRFEIFDDWRAVAEEEDADNHENYYGKIDASLFEDQESIPEYSYDLYMKVSEISDITTGAQTKFTCDARFINYNDEVLFFGTGLQNYAPGSRVAHDYDYDSNGEVFLVRKESNTSIEILRKNGMSLESTNFHFFDEGTPPELYKKVCTPRFLLGSKHDEIVLADSISEEHQQLLDKGVYINKVPGMIQINSRYFNFKKLLDDSGKRLALYDPEASPIPNRFKIDTDASLWSSYDRNFGGGNLYLYFNEIEGLDHLKGQEVAVCADGNSRGRFIVDENGKIDLGEVPAMYVSAGLPYTSFMKTVPFSGGSLLGSSVGCVGSQKSMYLYLYHSLGGKYGSEEDKVYDIQYPEFSYKVSKIRDLFTGIIKCPIMNAHDIYARTIYIEHDEPLAFNILQLTQDVEVSDA